MPKHKKVCYIDDDRTINNFEKLFILFNEFLCYIKLHYLMTNKYVIHNNINNLYNNILSFSNNFFEQYIILYNKEMPTNIDNIKINLSYNSNDLIPYIINFRDNINNYNKDEKNININNILNDIIFLINKFLYIITLE